MRVRAHDASANGIVRTKKTAEGGFEGFCGLAKRAMGALNILLQLLYKLDDLVVGDGRRSKCRRLE